MVNLKRFYNKVSKTLISIIRLKYLVIIQTIIIFIYSYLLLNSVFLFPITLILGIICALLLPGYNFLNLFFPNYNSIKKLGYMIIISLCIENIFMFFYYFFLYSQVTTTNKPGFFFNPLNLVINFQIMNFFFILLKEFIGIIKRKNHMLKKNRNDSGFLSLNKKSLKNFNSRIFFIFFIFIFSLILTCFFSIPIYRLYSNFQSVQIIYRENFTFFQNVQIGFYIFLTIAIISLVIIVFNSRNKYLILGSISFFIYIIWILPYIQIGTYFGYDSHLLKLIYLNYSKYGITTHDEQNYSFFVRDYNFRYSTSLFTSIIIVSATGMNIDFVLWFLYPLIFLFCPFFFYSFFLKFTLERDIKQINIVILTLFCILTSQFIRGAHSATTMIIGVYIYLILIFEFYDLTNEIKIGIIIKKFLFILFLYFFLCLTHFEECVYFILIIFIFNYFSTFLKIKQRKLKKEAYQFENNFVNYSLKTIKFTFLISQLMFFILITILYITLEFFGTVQFYMTLVSEESRFFDLINNFFRNYKESDNINTRYFKDTFIIKEYVLRIVILGSIILTFIFYISLFKFYKTIDWIYRKTIFLIKKTFILIKKTFKYKIINFSIFPILIFIILLINLKYYKFLEYEGSLLIIELILNYSIYFFHFFLFIQGVLRYKSENSKQNYFLTCIMASSLLMVFSFIMGNVFLSYHVLNSKFMTLFIILNLFIIQNTYFNDFMKRKRKYLMFLVFIMIYLGIFLSLRKIGWE